MGDRTSTPGKLLVAGIGNIFLGDDGFGVEVAQRLARRRLPPEVRVADFGIRGIHLAYELLEKAYEKAILVDAMRRGAQPGSVYLIAPEHSQLTSEVTPDAHGMSPEAVLLYLERLGGFPGRIRLVGCEPARIQEGIGLSEPVQGAVEAAIDMIMDLLGQEERWD